MGYILIIFQTVVTVPTCSSCEPGYYGNPMEPGSTCQRCRCHGNVAGGVCHPLTGACEHCQGHTEGAQCERCVEGYYGSAVNGSCYGETRVCISSRKPQMFLNLCAIKKYLTILKEIQNTHCARYREQLLKM